MRFCAMSQKFVAKFSFGDFKAVPIQINESFSRKKRKTKKNPPEKLLIRLLHLLFFNKGLLLCEVA